MMVSLHYRSVTAVGVSDDDDDETTTTTTKAVIEINPAMKEH
jgi:hypothetical protein